MRYRVFRGGEYVMTGDTGEGPNSKRSPNEFHGVQEGDVVYYMDVYWEICPDHSLFLSPRNPAVQGLYSKAVRAEMEETRVGRR